MKLKTIELMFLSAVVWGAPVPPKHVTATRQDAQAVRLTWTGAGDDTGYRLYAAYANDHLEFFQENKMPLHQNFVIWDAPRKGPRQFLFHLTAVDKSGQESKPSENVFFNFDGAERAPDSGRKNVRQTQRVHH